MPPLLVWSALAGGVLGALGARVNRVRTADEFSLWVVAGVVGGPLALAEWAGLARLIGRRPPSVLPLALGITLGTGLLGAALTPALDGSKYKAAWIASLSIKWLRSPLATTAGVLFALLQHLRSRPVNFLHGMLFIEAGPGPSALALGAVAWCQRRCFGEARCVSDALARHEAVHSRTVAAVGELGFYLTYLTAGVIWARAQGGPWNSLTPAGCGQPFEKTAHTFTGDPAVAVRCGKSNRVAGEQ